MRIITFLVWLPLLLTNYLNARFLHHAVGLATATSLIYAGAPHLHNTITPRDSFDQKKDNETVEEWYLRNIDDQYLKAIQEEDLELAKKFCSPFTHVKYPQNSTPLESKEVIIKGEATLKCFKNRNSSTLKGGEQEISNYYSSCIRHLKADANNLELQYDFHTFGNGSARKTYSTYKKKSKIPKIKTKDSSISLVVNPLFMPFFWYQDNIKSLIAHECGHIADKRLTRMELLNNDLLSRNLEKKLRHLDEYHADITSCSYNQSNIYNLPLFLHRAEFFYKVQNLPSSNSFFLALTTSSLILQKYKKPLSLSFVYALAYFTLSYRADSLRNHHTHPSNYKRCKFIKQFEEDLEKYEKPTP